MRNFNVGLAMVGNIKPVISLSAMSGSGKTFGSLSIAYGYLKEMHPTLSDAEVFAKIGFIDTERGGEASRIYIGQTIKDSLSGEEVTIRPYLHCPFEPPYGKPDLEAALQGIKQAGAEVVIIDSFTDFWEGEGGILWMQSQLAQVAGKGGMNTWTKPKLVHKEIIHAINNLDMFGIVTIRLKTEWAIQENGAPVKVGLKTNQSGDIEYEFDVALRIDKETHEYIIEKDRTNRMSGVPKGGVNPALGRHLAKVSKGVQEVIKGIPKPTTVIPVVEEPEPTPPPEVIEPPHDEIPIDMQPLDPLGVAVGEPEVRTMELRPEEQPQDDSPYGQVKELLASNPDNQDLHDTFNNMMGHLGIDKVEDIPEANIGLVLKTFQAKVGQ